MATRRCSDCGSEKPLDAFVKHPNHGRGYYITGRCRECLNAWNRIKLRGYLSPSRLAAQAAAKAARAERKAWTSKFCTRCGIEKRRDAFGVSHGKRIRVNSWCKQCRAAQAKERIAQPGGAERQAAVKKKYNDANRDRNNAYAKARWSKSEVKEHVKRYVRERRRSNLHFAVGWWVQNALQGSTSCCKGWQGSRHL